MKFIPYYVTQAERQLMARQEYARQESQARYAWLKQGEARPVMKRANARVIEASRLALPQE